MTMQLPLAQMSNRDGEAGMETMLWDISVIPNEQDKRYLMLPPGVLHMKRRFGRFTPFFTSRLTFQHLPCPCFLVLVFWVWGGCCFVVFLFPVLQVFWNPEFSAHFRPR